MTMDQYQALAVYAGFLFVVFLGGLVWIKLRKSIVRWFNVKEYYHHDDAGHDPA
jgi:hypothetical protein